MSEIVENESNERSVINQKRMKTPFLLTIILLSSINMLIANELEIRLSKTESVNAIIIQPDQFEGLKAVLKEVKRPLDKDSGITRAWKDSAAHYYIEFYNRLAFKFASKKQLNKVKNVRFLRIPYAQDSKKVSFVSDINKSTFEQLYDLVVEEISMDELTFFGRFYQLENTKAVLVKWSDAFAEGKYAILEDIKTMIGIDYDFSAYLDEQKQQRIAVNVYENRKPELAFEVVDGIHINSKVFRAELAQELNINERRLDYSIESLNVIETSLQWNSEHLNIYDVVLALCSYVGEVLVKEKSLKWQKASNDRYHDLITTEGEKLELYWKLQQSLLGEDYGIPEVKWVFDTLLEEID